MTFTKFTIASVAATMLAAVGSASSIEPQLIDPSEFDDRTRSTDPDAFDFFLTREYISNGTWNEAIFSIFIEDGGDFVFAGSDDVVLSAVTLISSSRGTTVLDLTASTFDGTANVLRIFFDEGSFIQPGEELVFAFGFNGGDDIDVDALQVFSGFAIPTPGAAVLLGVAGLASARRRR